MTLTNSHLLLVAPLALALGCGPRETSRPAGGQPPGAARPAGREVVQTTEERVRAMLRRLEFEFDGESYHALLGMGERAFPAFEEILADPNSDPGRVCNVYCLLCNGPADPGRFREHAIADLAHPDPGVRGNAANLLSRVGGPWDEAAVAALLSDAEVTVTFAAAKTLAAIGDWRTVNAMDAWLDANSDRAAGHLLHHVKQCRDALQRRLDAQLMSRGSPLPPTPPPHPRATDGA